MSLDITLYDEYGSIEFDANITHNLNKMAKEAGIYDWLWRADGKRARDLIAPLEAGLELMKSDPKRFIAFNAPNGWGTYDEFVPWVASCLRACKAFPTATIKVSR